MRPPALRVMLSNVSELLAVHTALEKIFSLPVEIERETPAIVLHCHARIVRTILPPASDQLIMGTNRYPLPAKQLAKLFRPTVLWPSDQAISLSETYASQRYFSCMWMLWRTECSSHTRLLWREPVGSGAS